MRKKVFGHQLGRDKNQRTALFRGLITDFIKNNELTTTLTKAKSIQAQLEKLITKGKNGTLNDRRIAHRFLAKKDLVNKLFEVIAPVFKNRNGGYTKIIKLGLRRGDKALMVKVTFTEEIPLEMEKKAPEEIKETEKKPKKEKKK